MSISSIVILIIQFHNYNIDLDLIRLAFKKPFIIHPCLKCWIYILQKKKAKYAKTHTHTHPYLISTIKTAQAYVHAMHH